VPNAVSPVCCSVLLVKSVDFHRSETWGNAQRLGGENQLGKCGEIGSQFENSVKAREATPENVSGQSNRAGVKIEEVNFLAKETFFD